MFFFLFLQESFSFFSANNVTLQLKSRSTMRDKVLSFTKSRAPLGFLTFETGLHLGTDRCEAPLC